MFNRFPIKLTLFILLLISAAARAETFVFTAIPDEDESHLQERFDKVARYLQSQLNVDVRYIPVKAMPRPSLLFATIKCNWPGLVDFPACRRAAWCLAAKPLPRATKISSSKPT